jgi:hypothetical protein
MDKSLTYGGETHKLPNLNKPYEQKNNSIELFQNSGLESNDPNIVSNRNGKVVHGEG